MTAIAHSTSGVAPGKRADHWKAVIAQAYFPLHLTFQDPAIFEGRLQMRSVGPLSVSRLRTEPLRYERRAQHISGGSEEQYLITIPRRAPVDFRQLGREVRCDPGGFILERGDEPYRFSYSSANDLCVLKVSKRLLSENLRNPDRFCAHVFNGRAGLGGFFTSMARSVESDAPDDPIAGEVLGRHLIELLSLAITGSGADVARGSVRAALLQQAQGMIRRNLQNPNLSPTQVAEACGISKRYLHEVFAESNCTVSQYIRERRLIAARDLLQMADAGSLADVAYRFGFSDQAQFSRLFRAMFGQTPSGYRARLTSG